MNTQDITMEQLETLVLIRSLEEFVTEEHEDFECLNDAVCNFADNLETEEFEKFARDICKLTKTGYVISDMTEITDEELAFHTMPEVEGITLGGNAVLKELEQDVKRNITEGKKIVLFENFTLFNLNASLLGGLELSLFKEAGGLFKYLKKGLKI